jgi:hypothetical protein
MRESNATLSDPGLHGRRIPVDLRRSCLGRAFDAASCGRMEETREAIAAFRLGETALLLEAVLEDDDCASEVAARSYWHGNGFCKIVLAERGGMKLRLHVWEAGRAAEENIHDHRWEFSSMVLSGRLVSATYREAPGGEPYRAHRYEGGRAGAYTLTEPEDVSLVCVGVQSLDAGSSYWMHSDELHAISRVSADVLTSTLVLTGPPRRGSTRLITQRTGVVLEHPATPLCVVELRRVVARLREMCGPTEIAA